MCRPSIDRGGQYPDLRIRTNWVLVAVITVMVDEGYVVMYNKWFKTQVI
jgi:hypothetical protein